jgi:hypothetical protein
MRDRPAPDELLFDVPTPLGFRVRCTRQYWEFIITFKHPAMAGHEDDVKAALQTPGEIRLSKTDVAVYLFYTTKRVGRWVCAVAKRQNGDGFLITAYPTDAVKEGESIWPK